MNFYIQKTIIAQFLFFMAPILSMTSKKEIDPAIIAAAKQHNQKVPLLTFTKDLLGLIVTATNNPIEESIKNALALSVTCTKFNTMLPDFGSMLQCYGVAARNEALEKILFTINDVNYHSKRRALLLLVYSGAEHNTVYAFCPLLQKAVFYNDIDMATVLFQYGANSNLSGRYCVKNPIFFDIKSQEMATIFINNKVNLHASGENFPNVLWWCCISLIRKKDMIPFYLNAGVDPKTINNQGECLLHDIAFKVQRMVFDDDIKVAQLILAKIPDMINHLDIKGRTPLDIAYEWNPNEDTNSMKERKQSLIQLFINHGAKTAKELKKNEP